MRTIERILLVGAIALGAPATARAEDAPSDEAPQTAAAPPDVAPHDAAAPDAAAHDAAEHDAAPPDAAAPAAATPTEPATAEPAARPPRAPLVYHLVVDVSFSHWLGSTFDAPAGIYTPSLTVHVVALDWLEIALHYTGSVIELPIPTTGRTSHVGYGDVALVLRRQLQVGGDLLMVGCGPLVGVVYDVLGAGIAFGADLGARYLVQLGSSVAIGPFFDVRAVFYDLPGDPRPFYALEGDRVVQGHLDAHVLIGAAIAF